MAEYNTEANSNDQTKKKSSLEDSAQRLDVIIFSITRTVRGRAYIFFHSLKRIQGKITGAI